MKIGTQENIVMQYFENINTYRYEKRLVQTYFHQHDYKKFWEIVRYIFIYYDANIPLQNNAAGIAKVDSSGRVYYLASNLKKFGLSTYENKLTHFYLKNLLHGYSNVSNKFYIKNNVVRCLNLRYL